MTGVGFLLGGVITALTTPPTAFAVSGLGVGCSSLALPGGLARGRGVLPRTTADRPEPRPLERAPVGPSRLARPRRSTGSTIGRRRRRS